MNISIGIALGSFIITTLAMLIKLGVTVGKLMQRLDENETRDKEEREKAAKKFDELYSDRNKHAQVLVRLDATMSNIDAKLEKMDGKLDRLMGGGDGTH